MTIKAGERLFQICMPDLRPFKVMIGGVNYNTTRGAGGFGSTGGGT
jgi:dUTPase